MYPKLPFDDTMAKVSFLGKKMQIQTNLKKIRMGMEVTGLKDISPEIVPEEKENEMDTTNRYDNEFPDEDMFEQIVRNAEEAEREKERSKGKKHAIKEYDNLASSIYLLLQGE